MVSVVIPLFNAEKTIVECIESVLSQDYQNVEVIVVDDGSTDDSIDHIRPFGERIRTYRIENQGPAAARNYGVSKARGHWIAFLDSDDVWDPHKLSAQLQAIGERKWCYTDCVFLGGVNHGLSNSNFSTLYEGDVLTRLALNNFIVTSSVVIEKEVLIANGGFDESLSSVEDWELWLRIAAVEPISYLNRPLVTYRIHSSSLSRNLHKSLNHHIDVLNRAFSSTGVLSQNKPLRRPAYSHVYKICAHLAEEAGELWLAAKLATMAAMYNWKRTLFAVKMLAKAVLELINPLMPSRLIRALNLQ